MAQVQTTKKGPDAKGQPGDFKRRCPLADVYCLPNKRKKMSKICSLVSVFVCPKDETMLDFARRVLRTKEGDLKGDFGMAQTLVGLTPFGVIHNNPNEFSMRRAYTAAHNAASKKETALRPKLEELRTAIKRNADDKTLQGIIAEINSIHA